MFLTNGTLLQGGKYKIVRHISSGGFGNTYEGLDVNHNKRVAIKEFFVSSMCSRGGDSKTMVITDKSQTETIKRVRRKFIEEAQTLLIMKHPSVVKAYDMFDENGTSYYTMEYFGAGSLGDKLKAEGPMSEEQALAYLKETCGALQYIHSRNRLHLDVKPNNIMLNSTGHAVLIDFGVSKHYSEQSNTNDTTLLGKSIGYAPIEQLENAVQKFTPSTDIYALGATLYKLVTGSTPPSATILLSEGLDLHSFRLSPRVAKIIASCMKVNKNERPQTIDEVLDFFDTEDTIFEAEDNTKAPNLLSVENCDAAGMAYWASGNFDKAMEYFESGWSRGGLDSLFHLALCYEQKGDYLTSTSLLKQASDKGHVDAQCQLAMCFEEGLGVPKNHRAAVKLCEMAANRGSLYGKEKLKGLDRSIGSLANYKALRWAILWFVVTILIVLFLAFAIFGDGHVSPVKLGRALPAPFITASLAFAQWQKYMKSLKY